MDLSCALDHPVVRGTDPQRVHLLLRLETLPEEGGESRKALNVALALDCSGSMAGPKLAALQAAVIALLERLGPEDVFSLVSFANAAEVLVPPGPVRDLADLRRRVQALTAAGGTNLSAGWLRALGLASREKGDGRISRVLLLTDGQANQGVVARPELVEIARQGREKGVTTTALGFGADFNEHDLTAVADAGGGQFHFIDGTEKASEAFLAEFGELARVSGQNAEVALVPGAGIPAPEVLGGLRVAADGTTRRIILGDLREHERRQILARFDLPAGMEPGDRELVAVQVRYDAVRGAIGARQHVLAARLTVDPNAPEALPAPEVARQVILEDTAVLERRAVDCLARRDFDGARRHLLAALRRLRDGEAIDAPAMEAEADRLRGLLPVLERDREEHSSIGSKTLTSWDSMRKSGTQVLRVRSASDRRGWSLAAGARGQIPEIVDTLTKALADLRYPADRVAALECAARELIDNAYRHGCAGRSGACVKVDLLLTRAYAQVTVRDDGPGFDLAAALARAELAEREKGGSPCPLGLLGIRRSVDDLSANAAGNEVRAGIRGPDSPFRVRCDTPAAGAAEIPVVAVEGGLDAQSAPRFEAVVAKAASRGGPRLVIDLTRCTYVASAGIAVCLGAAHRARLAGGAVALVCASAAIREAFRLVGVGDLFRFAPTVDAARDLLRPGA